MMKALKEIGTNVKKSFTPRVMIGVIVGNLICGTGIAILRVSHMGNDPYTAMNMAVTETIGMGLGTYQIILNLAILMIQLKWGRKYIGIGTIVNMLLLGYIVQFFIPVVEGIVGKEGSQSLYVQLAIMAVGLLILALGLAIYQSANAGVAPYDYLSMGMADALPTPYFANRVITDTVCVLVSLSTFVLGFQEFSGCHLGVSTIITAFCLGPLVGMFNKVVKVYYKK